MSKKRAEEKNIIAVLILLNFQFSTMVALAHNAKAMFSANLKNENYEIRTKEN